MQQQAFAPGFRLSALDAVILAVALVAAIGLSTIVSWWGFVVGFVLVHFFLFCNVVRMARLLELIWSAVFVMLASATIATDVPGWPATALASLAVTVMVVGFEMRNPSNHGFGWQRLNPGLSEWWESRTSGSGD